MKSTKGSRVHFPALLAKLTRTRNSDKQFAEALVRLVDVARKEDPAIAREVIRKAFGVGYDVATVCKGKRCIVATNVSRETAQTYVASFNRAARQDGKKTRARMMRAK